MQEPGYAATNWHSDLRMAPLDTNDFVTAWIPLRPLKVGGKKLQNPECALKGYDSRVLLVDLKREENSPSL